MAIRSALRRRAGLIALGLMCACGDATHTVGALASANTQEPTAGSAAQAGRGGGNMGTTAGTGTSPGMVGRNDAGLDASGSPDPMTMLGDAAFSCRGDASPAVRRRLDLLLMVDINLFSTLGTTLTAGINNAFLQTARGISSYVDDPRAAGTGVGIDYFPPPLALPGTPAQCDSDTYETPAAPIDLLPANAARIKASLPAPLTIGSPTEPALVGALSYASSRFQGLAFKQAVVLVTDRVSDFSCLSSPSAIIDAAEASARGNPPIPTYVIALGSPRLEGALSNFIRFEQLDAVAAGGGTGNAHAVDLDDAGDSLSETLHDIQLDAEPCQYEVGNEVRVDPSATALGTVTASGAPVPLPRVAANDECGQGYFFDNPDNPAWATLCKDTCSAVKAMDRGVVWIADCDDVR